MNHLKPATGKLAELENQYLKLKNKPTSQLVKICSLLDTLKRNGYTDKQLQELSILIEK